MGRKPQNGTFHAVREKMFRIWILYSSGSFDDESDEQIVSRNDRKAFMMEHVTRLANMEVWTVELLHVFEML